MDVAVPTAMGLVARSHFLIGWITSQKPSLDARLNKRRADASSVRAGHGAAASKVNQVIRA